MSCHESVMIVPRSRRKTHAALRLGQGVRRPVEETAPAVDSAEGVTS